MLKILELFSFFNLRVIGRLIGVLRLIESFHGMEIIAIIIIIR